MLRVRYAPGTEPWLPSADQVATLGRLLTAPAVAEIHPRASLSRLWAAQRPGRAIGACQVRAWARKAERDVFIFVDRSETPASVLWLLGHELGHLELRRAPLLELAVDVPQAPDYLTSDAAHEADPEEQACNAVGTAVLGLLTGRPRALDRLWWRRRVRALGICP